MRRTRPNGAKNQLELERFCEKEGSGIYLIRLYTPQSQHANVTNVADYILFANKVIILEVKETGADSFSTRTMQQKEELEEYKKFYSSAVALYTHLPYRAVVLVHFIRKGKYTAYFIDEGEFVVMHPDDDNCLTADSLPEIMEKILQ